MNSTAENGSRRLLGLFNKAASQTYNVIPKSLSRISKLNQEVEREWLLLGEPPMSPKVPPQATEQLAESNSVESTMLSDPSTSDIECIAKAEKQSDSESTTDIDAIVAEYEQTLTVTAAGPVETIRLPTSASWFISLAMIACIFLGTCGMVIGVHHNSKELYVPGLVIVILATSALTMLPRYQCSSSHPSSIVCSVTIVSSGIIFGTVLGSCWGPVIFWSTAAILLYIRCDRLMCVCLDNHYHHHRRQSDMREVLVPDGGCSGYAHKVNVPALPHGEFLQARVMGHR